MLPSTRRVKLNRNVLKIEGSNVPKRRRSFHSLHKATGEANGGPNTMSKDLDCSLQTDDNSEVTINDYSVLSDTESYVLKSENNVPLHLVKENGHLDSQVAVVEKPATVAPDSEEQTSTPLREGKQQVNRGVNEAETRDSNSLEDSGSGSDVVEAERIADVTGKPVAKRMRLVVKGDMTEQKQSNINKPPLHSGLATSSLRGNGEGSEPLCDVNLIHTNAVDAPVRLQISGVQDGSQRQGPGRCDGSLQSPAVETLSTWPENGTGEDPSLFSCRRVVPYMKRTPLSCARTYLTWPFPKPDSTLLCPATSPVHNANGTPTSSAESGSNGNAAEEEGLDGNNPPKPSMSTLPIPAKSQTDTDVDYFVSSSLSRAEKHIVSRLSSSVSTVSSPKDCSDAPLTSSLDPASTPSSVALIGDTPNPSPHLLPTSQDLCTPKRTDTGEAEAMLNKTRPSAVGSETDAASIHSAETFLLLPGLSSLSAESSVLPSSSSFLLPQEESERFEDQRKEGDDRKEETARSIDEREDEPEVLPGSLASSPENQEQRRQDQSRSSSLPLSRSHEGEAEAITNFAPEILRGPTPRLCLTRVWLQRCSEDGNTVNGKENGEDQKEALPCAEVVTQAQASATDEDDGRDDDESTCDEEEQSQSSGVENQESVVKTQSKWFYNPSKATFCTKVSAENQEAGTVSSSRSSSQNQEMAVSAGSQFVTARDTKADLLDEFTAYEQDILVVDVLLDDPELFGRMQPDSVPVLASTRGRAPRARTTIGAEGDSGAGPLWATDKSSTTCTEGLAGFKSDQKTMIHFKAEQSTGRSWRPVARSSPISALVHSSSWPPSDRALCPGQCGTDWNNNGYSPGKPNISERALAIQPVRSFKSSLPSMMTGNSWCNGRKAPATATETGPQRHIDSYCKYYFSLSGCFHKTCWFLHVPKKGDEKFCVDAVLRLVRSSDTVCLLRAVSVFTSYYQSSPPGVYYTPLILASLLTALLKAGFLSDIINVLHVSTAHNLLPSSEILLALFDYVRENDQSVLPELIQLTSKSTQTHPNKSAGNSTNQHGNLRSVVPPEARSLTRAAMEVEFCAQHEDWVRLGVVFRSVCHSYRSLAELQQFSGRVAIALLTETKDKLALPFITFSETVYQETEEWEHGLMKSFLGRIGVSLMYRYHKTQQWTKGRRLVEVLSKLKVNYSTLKGLFGNEDGASRCCLVTIATELFLRSDSVEGALNTLRAPSADNEWFLSSCVWPCSREDMTERRKVLVQLAEKTSHRDTLEVLTNLPGLKEPAELADASTHENLFNGHLKSCVDRQSVAVAADTLDFMLSKGIAVDLPLLHVLMHKLGKQNIWLRARALFKRALSLGYYPDVKALPGSLALTVPCSLGVMEMALAFEMVITLNAATILNTADKLQPITITLKRTGEGESEYLAAGSCLLSAAIVPNPKLTVHYTAVNSCQEQLFTMDGQATRRWLRHNHTWANDAWTGIDQRSQPAVANQCSL
ncbi:uncharacterized protein topaz1 isoform X4 [Esox lucius]|uniref:uncharacterized protein topaz1 isoform X4 n=1 Tax=Esox lucius TaxID=8010 RepID=UPI001477504F|nr:uncharacterized protein topaz1 isoform X4 [Esox lucius]